MAKKSTAGSQSVEPLPIEAEVVDTLAADPIDLKSAAVDDDAADDDAVDAENREPVDVKGAETAATEAPSIESADLKSLDAESTGVETAGAGPIASAINSSVDPESTEGAESSDDARPLNNERPSGELADAELPEAQGEAPGAAADAANPNNADAAGAAKAVVATVVIEDDDDAILAAELASSGPVVTGPVAPDGVAASQEVDPQEVDPQEVMSDAEVGTRTAIADLQAQLTQSQQREQVLQSKAKEQRVTIGEQRQHIAQLRASVEKMAALQRELAEAKEYIRNLTQGSSRQAAPQHSEMRSAAPAPPPVVPSKGRPAARPASRPFPISAAPASRRPSPSAASPSLPPMSTEQRPSGQAMTSPPPGVAPLQRPESTPRKTSGLQRVKRSTLAANNEGSSDAVPADAETQKAQPKLPSPKISDADIGWFD